MWFKSLMFFCWSIFVGFVATASSSAYMYYNYDQKARLAYDKVMSFRFEEAEAILDELKEEMPQNLAAHHIENYIDLFRAYTGLRIIHLKPLRRIVVKGSN